MLYELTAVLLPFVSALIVWYKMGYDPTSRHWQGRPSALAFATSLGAFVATSATCSIGMDLYPWLLTGALPAAAALSVHAVPLAPRHFRRSRSDKTTAGKMVLLLLVLCAAATAALLSVAQAWHMPVSTTLGYLVLPTGFAIMSTGKDVRHIKELSEEGAPMRRHVHLEWVAAASLVWPVVSTQSLFYLMVTFSHVSARLFHFLVFV